MNEFISQGAVANRNGSMFEAVLLPVFQRFGFPVYSEREIQMNPALVENCNKFVMTNASYTSIYGSTKSRTEYLIIHVNRSIRVEIKFQVSNGSVDEKYPYMLLNAIYAFPEKEVILIVDGGGYKEGARQWLQNMIDINWLNYRGMGKDIKLMTISDFITWFTKEFGRSNNAEIYQREGA